MVSLSSPYHTLLSRLTDFAIPYFKDGEVAMSVRQTNSMAGFKASDIRHPSIADHFHPDVWDGYDFGSFTTNYELDTLETRLEEKKNEVRAILSLAVNDPFQELDLVDKIQRIGLAYQFEEEIQDILKRTYHDDYTSFNHKSIEDKYTDLYLISLQFRLLQQAGYYVSPAIFEKFKDESGKFRANLALDILGMLSLYEASYLGFNGKDIIDDAMTFTTCHLQSIASDSTSQLASQVQNTLCTPLHHRVESISNGIHQDLW